MIRLASGPIEIGWVRTGLYSAAVAIAKPSPNTENRRRRRMFELPTIEGASIRATASLCAEDAIVQVVRPPRSQTLLIPLHHRRAALAPHTLAQSSAPPPLPSPRPPRSL